MLRRFLRFESGGPGTHKRRFARFCRDALENASPDDRSCFQRWVRTSVAEDFLESRLGFTPQAIGMIQDFVRDFAAGNVTLRPCSDPHCVDCGVAKAHCTHRGVEQVAEQSGEGQEEEKEKEEEEKEEKEEKEEEPKGLLADEAPGLISASLKALGLADFDFVVPDIMNDRQMEAAQAAAHILVKARTFVVHCMADEDNSSLEFARLRLRDVMVDGKRSLEARFMGTDEKYPALQPWIIDEARHQIVFFGKLHEPVFDFETDLMGSVPKINGEVMAGGRAIAMGIRRGAPVVVLSSVCEQGLLQELCLGAVSIAQLGNFLDTLDEDFVDFGTLDDHLHYLRSGRRLSTREALQ